MTYPDAMKLLVEKVAEHGQAEVARKLSVSAAAVSQILSGKYQAAPDAILGRVIEVFGGLSVECPVDGIPLEIETLDDQFEVAIARHEFPFKDGALLENMGQKARTVAIRCYFWDDGSHLTYNGHIKLVNHLKDKALFELTHPMKAVTGVGGSIMRKVMPIRSGPVLQLPVNC